MGSGASKKPNLPPQTSANTTVQKEHKLDKEVAEPSNKNTSAIQSKNEQSEANQVKQEKVEEISTPKKQVKEINQKEKDCEKEPYDSINSKNEDFTKLTQIDESEFRQVETTQLLGYEPGYADFPTSTMLKQENKEFVHFIKKSKAKLNDDLPSPNAMDKSSMFDGKKFTKVDDTALGAPRKLLQKSLEETVKFLIKTTSNDTEKVRVLFRWAAAQNLETLQVKEDVATDDEHNTLSILNKLKQNYITHGRFFEEMCKHAGLKCVTVQGSVKAQNYEVGDTIDFEGNKTEWSLVRMNNCWKLLDLNFASRHSSGGGVGEWELIGDDRKLRKMVEDNVQEGVVQNLNESYFLTNPEEYIFTHFPVNRSHQLLARSVTEREFQEMAYLWGTFFDLGFEATQSSMKGAIEAIDGEVDIDIKLPLKGKRRFMYQLWRSTKDGTSIDDFQGYKFNQFVFIQQKGGMMMCKVIFPIAGKYKIEFYARNSDQDGKKGEDRTCKPVAKYLITCDPAKDNPIAFPENRRMEWGPGTDMYVHGMTPISHPQAVIETDTGNVQLTFNTGKEGGIMPVLRSTNGKMDHKLKKFVLHSDNNGQTKVDVKLPEGGSYALDICGKAGKDGGHPLLCTYLINTTEGSADKSPFPGVPHQRAGPVCRKKNLEITCLSHKEPFFTSETGEVEIELQLPTILDLKANLHLQGKDKQEELQNHVFVEQKGNKVKFKVRFPKPGTYLLGVYGKEQGSMTDGLPNIYNYVINVPNPEEGCKPYPEVFAMWKDGCQISGVEDGVLPCGEEVDVKIRVPDAKEVAMIGKEWTKFTKNSDGEWEGKVKASEQDDSLQLCAAFDDSGNYSPLLKYKTLSKKQVEAEKKLKRNKEKELLEKKKAEEEKQKKAAEQIELLEKELDQALRTKDLKTLKNIARRIEKQNCTQKFLAKYNTAKELIKSLERTRRLQKIILKMNQETIAEIRSYSSPPGLVKDVMVASLLLLGHNEGSTKEWKNCQALCNSVELKKRVRQLHVETLHPEIAVRARQILSKYRLDDVREASAGAACFYAWSNGMIEELNISRNGILATTTPAALKRQK